MVEAVSAAPNLKQTSQRKSSQNPTRPPLLPSETGNNVPANRRPKPREVSSRYLSTSSSSSASASSSISSSTVPNSSSRRCATPIVSRARVKRMEVTPSPASAAAKRSQSAERRRPATPRSNGAAIGVEMSAAAKMLASSRRCLSVSFQGESFSVSKSTPSPNLRKATPERRRTASAATTPKKEGDNMHNGRPVEQQPWPSRSRQVSSLKSMSQSVDLGSVRKTLNGQSRNAVRDIRQSLPDGINRIQHDAKLQNANSRARLFSGDGNAVSSLSLNRSISTSESTTSETESVCSDNNDSPKDNRNVPQGRAGPRGVVVPARFLQETNSRLRRLPEPRSPLSRSNSLKATISTTPRGNLVSRGLSPLRSNMRPSTPSRPSTPLLLEKSSPSRGMASPSRTRNVTMGTPLLPEKSSSRGMASPSRARNATMGTPLLPEKSSPSRGMASPSRARNATMGTPSVLCFAADARRGKVHENKIGDAHLLRLLYNRQLQWRFANARAEAAISLQLTNAERNLYDVWRATSELRISVSKKRLELARLILKLKLTSILEKQMLYLDEWAFMENDHSSSLLGAVESLKASTLRLPIVGGAVTDIQGVKNALCSALDVLQAMASPICSWLSEVEQMNSLLAEMASIVSNERAFLDDCKYFVSSLATLQVKDCSLRTHILQLKRVPSSSC